MARQSAAAVSKAIGRIAELRESCDWTQQEFADRLDVSVKYAQRLESGSENLRIDTLVHIANALGVKVAALFEKPASLARRSPGRPRRTQNSQDRDGS